MRNFTYFRMYSVKKFFLKNVFAEKGKKNKEQGKKEKK